MLKCDASRYRSAKGCFELRGVEAAFTRIPRGMLERQLAGAAHVKLASDYEVDCLFIVDR